MNDAVEKLKAELSKNADRLRNIEHEIAALNQERDEVETQVGGLEFAIGILTVDKSSGPMTPPLNGHGKYASMTLSDAIADVVNSFGNIPGLLVPEIITKLRAEGAKSSAKDLYSSVYSLTRRLVDTDKIATGKKNGKLSFVRK